MPRKKTRVPKPENEIEEEFLEVVTAHRKEIDDAYALAVSLSEQYGIPFGSYVPKSFNKKFRGHEGPEPDYEWIDGVSVDFIGETCNMDEAWFSSTTRCEFYNY